MFRDYEKYESEEWIESIRVDRDFQGNETIEHVGWHYVGKDIPTCANCRHWSKREGAYGYCEQRDLMTKPNEECIKQSHGWLDEETREFQKKKGIYRK